MRVRPRLRWAALFLAAVAGVEFGARPQSASATVKVDSDLDAAYATCTATFTGPFAVNLSNLVLSKYAFSIEPTKQIGTFEGYTQTVADDGANASNGVGTGATINWFPNPTAPLAGGTPANGCAALYHEIFHARQDNQGSRNQSICWYTDGSGTYVNSYLPIDEIQATWAENAYRAARGLPVRTVFPSLYLNPTNPPPVPLPPPGTVCEPPPSPTPAPTPPGGGTGRSFGDPHIVAYDGYPFEFQSAGEFVLTRSIDGAFEIQMRSQPVPGRGDLTLNTAVALKLGADRLVRYTTATPDGDPRPLRLNGLPVAPANGAVVSLPGGATVSVSGGDVFVQARSGERVTLHGATMGSFAFVNVSVTIPAARAGDYVAILGDGSGNRRGDLRTRSGQSVALANAYARVGEALGLTSAFPAADGAFHAFVDRTFADSWRIGPQESLFDYAPGTSTTSFTDRSYPRDDFTPASDAVLGAAPACRRAGVPQALLAACVVDVSATNDASFATAIAKAESLVGVRLGSPVDVIRTLAPLVNPSLPTLPSLPGIPSIPHLPF